jgi:hypothetical protein
MAADYRFFIGGIIQGSKYDHSIHNQDYRRSITVILREAFPYCDIFCPVENHPDSISYDDSKAKQVFMGHLDEVKKSHCLIVYLPEASLGSAIEMWEAFGQDRIIVTISPMAANWVVRILSCQICPDIQSFYTFVADGRLKQCLEDKFLIHGE